MTCKRKEMLLACFEAGVNACLPVNCLPQYLPDLGGVDSLCVLGAGKASTQMAAVLNSTYPGICYGTVVTRYGHATGQETGNIRIVEAGHPVPDENSLKAADLILEEAKNVPEGVPVFVLLSGGGSALLCKPVGGVSFQEKMAIHEFLLKSGASIKEINCVRTQLSAVKGGKLARLLGRKLKATYIVSDVVGDDPAVVASGPTVEPIAKADDALRVLRQYNGPEIPAINAALGNAAIQEQEPTSHPVHIVASATVMLNAAAQRAHELGLACQLIAVDEIGEAQMVARKHAELAKNARNKGWPCLLLSGGELTVTHSGQGRGGPNQEYLLALAEALDGASGIYAVACDSDGVDGSENNAGAFIAPDTLLRAEALGLSATRHLEMHDSFSYFAALNDLIITGPTGTNVNDFRAILVEP